MLCLGLDILLLLGLVLIVLLGRDITLQLEMRPVQFVRTWRHSDREAAAMMMSA